MGMPTSCHRVFSSGVGYHPNFEISRTGILKCLQHKTWIDESPHEVKGTNDAVVDTPRRARTNSLKQVSQFNQKFHSPLTESQGCYGD